MKNKRKTIEDSPYGLCTKAKLSSSQAENTILENPTNFLIIGNKDDTLDTIKEKFNGATIQYKLDKEEIIPYTQEQQAVIDKILYTYKNVTNISVDDELATLDITYKKDIETMFNNQAKEYNERLSNIENLLNTTETSALLLDNLESDLEKEV